MDIPKKGCRLCDLEVYLENLRDHSFKCKYLSDLQDDMDALNTKISSRIREAIQLKTRIVQSITTRHKPEFTNEHIAKIEDLSKSNRALKKVLAYGDKIQHENFLDYDNATERELLDELAAARKEIEEEDIWNFLFFFCNLIEEKKQLKITMGKLDLELKKTLASVDSNNPDAIKQAFFNQKSRSFKHQKSSPKLFGNVDISNKNELQEGQNGNYILQNGLWERNLPKNLETIQEIDSVMGTPCIQKKTTRGTLKQMGLLIGDREVKSCGDPNSQSNSPDCESPGTMNLSAMIRSKIKTAPQSSFAKTKNLKKSGSAVEEERKTMSSLLQRNLITVKLNQPVGKDNNSIQHIKGPVKATEAYSPTKAAKDEVVSKKQRPSLPLQQGNEINNAPDLGKNQESKTRQNKHVAKPKRANSLTLFNKLEGEEKYQMNRFPSLSREASPEEEKGKTASQALEKAKHSQINVSQTKKPKEKKTQIGMVFVEDGFFDDDERKITEDQKTAGIKAVYYESPSLKGYNSETSSRNEVKKHS